MHGDPAPRDRPCDTACLPAAAPPQMAAAVRQVVGDLSRLLSPQPGQPQLRAASPPLVCAEPSGRGFRRDLRGLDGPETQMAEALCRLAGAEEAGIRRRADGR